jgi:hypothetical protein
MQGNIIVDKQSRTTLWLVYADLKASELLERMEIVFGRPVVILAALKACYSAATAELGHDNTDGQSIVVGLKEGVRILRCNSSGSIHILAIDPSPNLEDGSLRVRQ